MRAGGAIEGRLRTHVLGLHALEFRHCGLCLREKLRARRTGLCARCSVERSPGGQVVPPEAPVARRQEERFSRLPARLHEAIPGVRVRAFENVAPDFEPEHLETLAV